MVPKNEIKSKAISGAIWKFAERTSAQIVSMVVTIVLARLLNPSDYSVVSIVSIFFAFANVFVNSGFNVALIQKKEIDREAYSSALVLTVLVAVILYGLFFCAAPLIAQLYKTSLLIPVIRLMALAIPVNAVKSIVCAYISSTLQFRKLFFATLAGIITSAVVGISMAYMGYGPWALVAQQLTNICIDTVILWITTRVPLAIRISVNKTKELFQYGWKIVVSSVIDVAYKEINPLFIGLKYSGTDLAFYTKGKSFPSLITATCSSTLSSVLFPVLSKFQNEPDELTRILRRFNKTASFIVFPVLMGFYAVSDNFILLLLTEKWMPIAPYIRIFCLSEMVMVIEAGNREALKAIGRSDVFLKFEIIKKCLFFGIIGLCIFNTSSPEALAYSSLGCATVVLCCSVGVNEYIFGYSISNQICDLLPNFLCAIIMSLGVQYFYRYNLLVGIELVVQITVGIVIYICACVLMRNENLEYALAWIKPVLISCKNRIIRTKRK